jgi:DNA-binding transcriptional MerR regulator
MRELEARTGVHRETIRVYLRHGLIPQPARPRRNVADYDDAHVDAVLAVRRLQESRFTLPQIRSMMNGYVADQRVGANDFSHLERLVSSRVGLNEHLITVDSLVERFPEARKDARTFDAMGVIEIVQDDGHEALSLPDAEIVSIWGEMRAAGFDESLEFRPEMLDFYIEATEFVAGWEARTFLDRTEGWIGEDAAAAMIERAFPLMLNFFGLLRRKAFLRNITAGGKRRGSAAPPPELKAPSSGRPSRSGRRAGPRPRD